MNNFLFIIYIICFLPGITSIIFAMIYYIISKKNIILYYILIIIFISLIMFIGIITTYLYIDIKKNYDIFLVFLIFLRTFFVSFLIYLVPKFFHGIIKIKFNVYIQVSLIFLSIIAVLMEVFILATRTSEFVENIKTLIFYYINIVPIFFYVSILYSIFLILKFRKNINNYENKMFFKGFILVSIPIIPLVILQYLIHFYKIINIPFNLSFEWFHYFAWNCFYIYYIIKIYFSEKFYPEEIFNTFIKKYKITNKEKEIILLIKKGLLNKEIAFNLSISEGTVKIHIYNIFQKTGVNTRIDLINLISN